MSAPVAPPAASVAGSSAGASSKAVVGPQASQSLSIKNVWAPPVWSGRGCSHLLEWLASPTWKKDYSAILQFVNSVHLQKLGGKSVMQKETTVCFKCREGPLRRLYVSLHSPYVGCKEGGCMEAYVQQSKQMLAMDMKLGEVYCFGCKDIVYDVRLEEERTAFAHTLKAVHDRGESSTQESPAKRACIPCDTNRGDNMRRHCLPRRTDWVPTPPQVQALKDQAAQPEVDAGIAGLRGLHNLGNTCFLNCVLQALVNNPGVRDYFLGDYHNRYRCKLRREQSGQVGDYVCMGCEMDQLVDECFQGSKAAFSPHSFLFGMWKSSQHLAGYEQQDAHECFISVLDALQNACKDDLNREGHAHADLMQRLFRGIMRSDVTCLTCRKRSLTKDPFLDISLDLRRETISASAAHDPPPPLADSKAALKETDAAAAGSGAAGRGGDVGAGREGAKESGGQEGRKGESNSAEERGGGGAGGGGDVGSAPDIISLEECLKRFTEVEKLDHSSSWRCEECSSKSKQGDDAAAAADGATAGGASSAGSSSSSRNTRLGGIKQLSIQSVAPSLCVQLKRFESSRTNGGQTYSKIDTYVKFPLRLDLAPYLSTSVLARGEQWLEEYLKTSKAASSTGTSLPLPAPVLDAAGAASPAWYSLYAVVVHHGRMDSGHYSAFVRRGREWFSCDDSAIVMVSEQQVLECQAYLLYYMSCEP